MNHGEHGEHGDVGRGVFSIRLSRAVEKAIGDRIESGEVFGFVICANCNAKIHIREAFKCYYCLAFHCDECSAKHFGKERHVYWEEIGKAGK
jgi:hypothetical protein